MWTVFPSAVDAFNNPSALDNLDTVGVVHHVQHSDSNDAVEALETKVWVDNSAVTSSLDYKVAHKVTSVWAWTWISVNNTDPVNPVVTNSSPDQTVAIAWTGIATVTWTYPNFSVAVPATDISGKVDKLTPVTVQTANYTAHANELVPVNLSWGSFAVTLPTAPADGTQVMVDVVIIGTTWVCEVKCWGTDKFVRVGWPTSLYMNLQTENVKLQYQSSTGIWFVTPAAAPSNFAVGFSWVDAQTPITNANITIDTTARTLTVTPPLWYFNIFVDGNGKINKYRKTTVTFPAWTDTSGTRYFYFDSTGTAVTSQAPRSVSDFPTIAAIYRVLWNSTLSWAAKLVAQYIEYHTNDIPPDTHAWMHLQGSIWSNGLWLISTPLPAWTPNASWVNTCVSVNTWTVIDDNLPYTVTNNTSGNTWTQDMGNTTAASITVSNAWLFKIFIQDAWGNISFLPATRFPFDWSSGTNRAAYITSTGTRTEVPNNTRFVYFMYATQNPTSGEAIKIVSAPANYASLALAQAITWWTIQNTYTALGNDNEIRPLCRMIFFSHPTGWGSYPAACKYTSLLEVQDIRKAIVSSTTVSWGSLPATSVTETNYGNVQTAINTLVAADATLTPMTRNISTTAPLSWGWDLSADRTLTTSMATGKLIGRWTAWTGVMEEITLWTNLSLSGTTLNATWGGSAFSYLNTQIMF